MWRTFCRHPVVKFLASLKLAVFVILAFTALMVWGTLAESLYGTEYAKWRVYLSPTFILVEALLFVNVLFAALVRLPWKKQLSGFYITHLGILTLFVGSALTALYGVDGSMQLTPGKEVSYVLISDPVLYGWHEQDAGKKTTEEFEPIARVVKRSSFSKSPNLEVGGYQVFLDDYIPYAVARFVFKPNEASDPQSLIVRANLKNAMTAQSLELNTFDKKNMQTKLGPLTVRLDTVMTGDCLKKALSWPRGWLLLTQKGCFVFDKMPETTVLKDEIQVEKLNDSVFEHYRVTEAGLVYDFYPALSEFPVDENVVVKSYSSVKLVMLEKFFVDSPQLVFLQDGQVAWGKGSDWQVQNITPLSPVSLPWMGLELTVSEVLRNHKQEAIWSEKLPVGGTSDATSNQRWRAAKARVVRASDGQLIRELWIDNMRTHPVKLEDGSVLDLAIGRTLVRLPFAIKLDHFKMDMNPGTQDPASYESTVTVVSESGESQHKIFMNNPMKRDKYTFYQASYFELEEGGYGSTLSVNYDPGRAAKYLGSLLIVFGATLYYLMKKRTVAQ